MHRDKLNSKQKLKAEHRGEMVSLIDNSLTDQKPGQKMTYLLISNDQLPYRIYECAKDYNHHCSFDYVDDDGGRWKKMKVILWNWEGLKNTSRSSYQISLD